MTLKIRELPKEERPRERLLNQGSTSLREAELVAILLRMGTKGISAVTLAEQLIKQFNGLDGIAQASTRDLAKVKGIGLTKAVQLKAAFEIGIRLSRKMVQSQKMDEPSKINSLVGEEMRILSYESVRLVLLNTKYHLIGLEEVSKGLLDQALIHAREIFSAIISRKAYAFILVHNHPSGDPTPSDADMQMTRRLKEASKLMDIPMLDHLIIGKKTEHFPNGWFSFKAAGCL